MSKKFEIELIVNNIGPHCDEHGLNFSGEISDNRSIIFATNGMGKTFISRSFKLASQDKCESTMDDLLSLDAITGNFSFTINRERKLSLYLKKGEIPLIKNETGLIFHVFNSDYVKENIELNNYAMNGNIDGYILGKENIDLTSEYKQKNDTFEKLNTIGKEIDAKIEEARNELRTIGVKRTTNEFELIDKSRLLGNEEFSNIPSFETIKKQLDKLATVPESIPDIQAPRISINITDILDGTKILLISKYPKTTWDESFALEMQQNQNFIEAGVKRITEKNICPFCKQVLGIDALALIKQYKLYLNDKETEVLRNIDSTIERVNDIIREINKFSESTKDAVLSLSRLQEYFPSLSEVKLSTLCQNNGVCNNLCDLISMLNSKKADLTKEIMECLPILTLCHNKINDINKSEHDNEILIGKVNSTKNDSKDERLSLRRNLCKAQYVKYKKILQPYFENEQNISEKLVGLSTSIKEKEDKIKTSKRDRVYETLRYYLNQFFADKYSIDKETFKLRFFEHSLSNNAMRVLSDGEKSVVAFCFYLASTHLLVEHESDYNKLFFIIDDPISSMDYDHVYALAQSIRTLKSYFNIESSIRVLIFTHNIEFLSMVRRNRIVRNAYILTPGQLSIIKDELILPYEGHLRCIVGIADGQMQPSCTVPNSIRHVLETICHFENPNKPLIDFVNENDILSKNSCIYSLCEDMSHGAIRKQPSYTSVMLIDACKTVKEFIKERYEGQLDSLSK